ncbi:hypothetical protein ACFOWM_10360 [Ferruginibacter yonginensis]|uniref:Lipoprotein n=1 Tax=Ferruginibacter yonginensis TaxID=1310416 RepID=A0ABV8QUB4_9BACT
MKSVLQFTVIIALLSIIACKQQTPKQAPSSPTVNIPLAKKTILGTWRLADVRRLSAIKSSSDDALLEKAELNQLVQMGMLLSFFPDETYTLITGSNGYTAGNFKSDKQAKTLILNNRQTIDSLKYQYDQNAERSFLLIQDKKNNLFLKFVNEAPLGNDFKEEPYWSTNNEWRMKPLKPESPAALQLRLGNYFKHIAYILKTANDKKLQRVSFEFSEGILKIYDGGIGICAVDNIPASWQNCFYNKNQALTAYEMYNTYLKKSKRYKGSSTGNWIEDDYNVLTSIYGALKGGEFPLQVDLPAVSNN